MNTIIETYNLSNLKYLFIWIDDFSPLESEKTHSQAFATLIKSLNEIGKKPIMSYGGYDSILLCNSTSPIKLYGVAQSVGYGEKRNITPVGGGLPVNKFYFPELHQRLKSEDISKILYSLGLFNESVSSKQRATNFYNKVCNCPQCKNIIKDNFENFSEYLESNPFTMKTGVRRNRPTQKSLEISARHFLYCKVNEWSDVEQKDFESLSANYINAIKQYSLYFNNSLINKADNWAKIYGK